MGVVDGIFILVAGVMLVAMWRIPAHDPDPRIRRFSILLSVAALVSLANIVRLLPWAMLTSTERTQLVVAAAMLVLILVFLPLRSRRGRTSSPVEEGGSGEG